MIFADSSLMWRDSHTRLLHLRDRGSGSDRWSRYPRYLPGPAGALMPWMTCALQLDEAERAAGLELPATRAAAVEQAGEFSARTLE
ncbi:hypothetical protein OG225_08280 [Nocardia sp. NBC_01377]|uniref:hypothetical protein n=1 Tax=Nocardia sp. NBC_01377 TaxID=2903595 RepID=UPI0032458CD4